MKLLCILIAILALIGSSFGVNYFTKLFSKTKSPANEDSIEAGILEDIKSGRFSNETNPKWRGGVHLRIQRYMEDLNRKLNPKWAEAATFTKRQKELQQIRKELELLYKHNNLSAARQEYYLTQLCRKMDRLEIPKISFGKCSPSANANINSENPSEWVDCCLHHQTIQSLTMGEGTIVAILTTQDETVKYFRSSAN